MFLDAKQDPIITIERDGTPSNPFVDISENLTVTYNRILLLEIPDPYNRLVVMKGSTVYDEVDEVDEIVSNNQYYVDYRKASVHFHNNANGVELSISYKGMGVILYPATRIYVDNDENINITTTLQNMVDEAINVTIDGDYARAQGDYAKDMGDLVDSSITDLSDLRDDVNTATSNADSKATYAEEQGDYAKQQGESASQGEQIRDDNEADRIISEQTRKDDETTRNSNESGRILAETDRLSSESDRKSSETARKTAEVNRDDAETIRESNEAIRESSEDTRKSAESDRSNSEDSRIIAENTRISNETDRITSSAQALNDANNAKNISNDIIDDLSNKVTIADDLISDVGVAVDDANNAITNTNVVSGNMQNIIDSSKHLGSYSNLVQYEIHNEVLYNGSTWRCIQNSLGNIPSEGQYWTLVAMRGVDGQGTVNSVNNVLADENFNIELSPSDIGAISSSVVGQPNGIAELDSNSKVPVEQLPESVKQRTFLVNSESERDDLTNLIAGDEAFNSTTGHSHIWNGVEWIIKSSGEVEWDNILSKPSSSITDIDESVISSHSHSNNNILDEIEEPFKTIDKDKLGGIESGANKYIHPSTHPADIIDESPDKRFVSDSEKSNWGAKETQQGAQQKADTAEQNAKDYADNLAMDSGDGSIGGRFKWVYNETTDSLDLIII